MIRTAFAVFFVAVSACAASFSPVQAAPLAAITAGCTKIDAPSDHCGDRQVTRGHADLAPRYIDPASAEAVSAA